MRRFLVYLAFTLAASLAIYLGFGADAYVLIHAGDTAIQMTIWLAIIFLCLTLAILSIVWMVISGVFFGGWRRAWMRKRLDRLTASAVKSYTDQDWGKAYKQLVKLANSHPEPQPYVIMAGEAAVASGDIEKGRETYQQLMQRFPDNSYQARLRLAYLELGAGNHEQAAELCEALLGEKKRDPDARLLQILIAEDQGNWEQMHEKILAAQSNKMLSSRLPIIERRYLRAVLADNPSAPQLLQLSELFTSAPILPIDKTVDLARQLAMKGMPDKAEKFLRNRINRQWDETLVEAYGNIEGKSAKGQVKVAESWLDKHPDNRVLLETLLQLSVRANDEKRIEIYEGKLETIE
ncbi:MAG: heme biosynthesis HemY N-terminal domain-containing protein [Pseudomonadales bacterium]